jgi:protein-tyrosine phosphatase
MSQAVVACLLRDAGLDAEAAIALTRATRHGAIENEAQERFVGEWGPTAVRERGGPTR